LEGGSKRESEEQREASSTLSRERKREPGREREKRARGKKKERKKKGEEKKSVFFKKFDFSSSTGLVCIPFLALLFLFSVAPKLASNDAESENEGSPAAHRCARATAGAAGAVFSGGSKRECVPTRDDDENVCDDDDAFPIAASSRL
jgi:hypothetical protein